MFKKFLVLSKFTKKIKVSNFFSTKYLIFTNAAISLSIAGTSDFLNQNYEIITEKRKEWSWLRTRNQWLLGLCFGPVYHFWYKFLDSVIIGLGTTVALKKLFLDQLVMVPISIILYLSFLHFLEGKWKYTFVMTNNEEKIEITLDEFVEKEKNFNFNVKSSNYKDPLTLDIEKKGPKLLKFEWTFGPFFQLINFYFLPYKFRVLYDNIISFIFESYYTYIKYEQKDDPFLIKNKINKKKKKNQEDKEEEEEEEEEEEDLEKENHYNTDKIKHDND